MQPKKIIEKMSDEDLAILSSTLPLEFERRGLAMTSAVPVLNATKPVEAADSDFAVTFNLKDEYTKAVRALSDLSISTSNGQSVPSYDAVAHSVDPEILDWLDLRARTGVHDELIIAPALGEMSLEQLLRRFDRKQPVPSYVWQELWNKYDPVELNNRTKGWQIAVILNDIRDPRDHREAVNDYGEPGLVYTGMSLADQQKAFRREAKSLAKRGYTLKGLTISQLIMLNTRRRLLDQPQLDERTFTRLIQHQPTEVADFEWVPAVSWLRGRMRLFGSDASLGWGRFGVRRAIAVDVNNVTKN